MRRASIEDSGTHPTAIELIRRARDTRAFLRMAAIEARRISEQAPDIAVKLRHLAQQLDAEAEDWLAAVPHEGASVGTEPDQKPNLNPAINAKP